MTCKDCIHHDLCFDNGTLFLRYAKGIDKENAETKCPFKNFKNKADYAEVKHGEWIWLEGNLYECSECPNKTEVDEKMNQPSYAYCPYCGAKMDGGKDINVPTKDG